MYKNKSNEKKSVYQTQCPTIKNENRTAENQVTDKSL